MNDQHADYWWLSCSKTEQVRLTVEALLTRVQEYIVKRRPWEKYTLEVIWDALDKIAGERRKERIN